jgi:hypothetical protein
VNIQRASFDLKRAMVVAALIAPLATGATAQSRPAASPLKNMQVSGILSDGGSFTGRLTVTQFGYDAVKGLTVNGVLTGTARAVTGVATPVNQSFTDAKATLNELGLPSLRSLLPQGNSGANAANGNTANGSTAQALAAPAAPVGSCGLLHLDLGPIFLDLLGLQLDLSQVVLDLSAVPGAGNLLGNLLCAVAGLLDPLGFLTDVTNFLATLTGLLNQLNGLLG